MATLAPDPDGDPLTVPDREPTRRTPRWVVVFGIIAVVLVVLFVIVMLTGGGEHGPGRHASTGDSLTQTSPSGATRSSDAGGHGPPSGGHGANRGDEAADLAVR